MDRQIVYTAALMQDTDFLKTNKNTMLAIGNALQMVLGTGTQIDGLACTGGTGLTVNVGPGSIITQSTVDATAYGSLPLDTTDNVMKQGIILTTTNLPCPAPTTSGFSINYLVQAAFSEQDTGPQTLQYYNVANPSLPFNGPNNLGTSQNTVRQGLCSISLVAGTAATTGTQTTPSASAGYTPLYVVTVANGQATITSGNISTVNGAPILLDKLSNKISQSAADARYVRLANQIFWEGTDTGSANVYAIAPTSAPAAYATGQVFGFTPTHANTGASTLNVSSLGAKSILMPDGSALLQNAMVTTGFYLAQYNGTAMVLLNPNPWVMQDQAAYAADTGTANTYAVAPVPAYGAYFTGLVIQMAPANANTGTSTLNVNGLGAITIKMPDGSNLPQNAMVTTGEYHLQYNGTIFVLMNPNPYVTNRLLTQATDTGSANAYAIAPSPSIGAYAAGQIVTLIPAHANSGASTIAVSGLAAKNILNQDGSSLASGQLLTTGIYVLEYNGTAFVLADAYTTDGATLQLVNGVLSVAPGGIGNTQIANMAANTLKANATAGSAGPTDVAVTASSLVGRGAGNITNITPGGGLVISGSQLNTPGGFLNVVRNPVCMISQRGPSGTVTTGNNKYTIDGMMVGPTGATVSWSQQGNLTLPNGGVAPNSLKLTGATSMTQLTLTHRAESNRASILAGQICTFQVTIQNNTGATLTPTLTTQYAGSADNWGAPVTDLAATNLQSIANGATATLSYTLAVNANAVNGYSAILSFGSSLNSAANNIVISAMDLRATPGVATGLNANPPPSEWKPYSLELLDCQRFVLALGGASGNVLGIGAATSTTAFGIYIPLPTQWRATGSLALAVNTMADLEVLNMAAGGATVITGLTLVGGGQNAIFLTGTVASGLTSGSTYMLYTLTGLAGNVLITGPEL